MKKKMEEMEEIYNEKVLLKDLSEQFGKESEGNGRDSVRLQIVTREMEKMMKDYVEMREMNINLKAENDDYYHRVLLIYLILLLIVCKYNIRNEWNF